jgi:purine-binding chemotaxis protein CheW
MDFLVFDAAERRFGLPAAVIQEVVRIPAITLLPRAPAIVEGVVNVRGTVVAVLDIRARFGLPARPVDLDQHLIVARTAARPVALRVDRALDLITVAPGTIESADSVAPGLDHVAGIIRLPDGLLIIQALERFLSMEESRAVGEAMVGSPS